jgi:hypothetical protein
MVRKKKIAKKIAKRKVAKKRAVKKKVTRRNPVKRNLYVAFVRDQNRTKFYYGGVNPARKTIILNDDIKYAGLFQSMKAARETAKFTIESLHGKGALKNIGSIHTELYFPK